MCIFSQFSETCYLIFWCMFLKIDWKYTYPPVPLMPDLVYQYSCTRILDLQYSTVVLGSYTAVQHRSYCITVLAVRILLYELYSTVLYCTTSIGHANGEFSVCILIWNRAWQPAKNPGGTSTAVSNSHLNSEYARIFSKTIHAVQDFWVPVNLQTNYM